jgi:hypothetical protein
MKIQGTGDQESGAFQPVLDQSRAKTVPCPLFPGPCFIKSLVTAGWAFYNPSNTIMSGGTATSCPPVFNCGENVVEISGNAREIIVFHFGNSQEH